MSVILFDRKFIENVNESLRDREDVLKFIKAQKHYKYRAEYSFESPKEYLGRMLWYMYVANITAYNLQYQENELIDFSDVKAVKGKTLSEAISDLGRLLYNVVTNDGNYFIDKEWLQTARMLHHEFHPEKLKFEKQKV
tara:strand:- start:418 stop:831 length:414 start_codon:yes stop_codon:yes gene_type:complete